MKGRLPVILSIVVAAIVIGAAAFALTSKDSNAASCSSDSGHTYMVEIKHNKPSSSTVRGKLCDKIMFMNEDSVTREIAFGPHEHHVPYDGVAERVLKAGQSFTITLNATGNYHWHDHIHDEVQGDFVVTK